MDIIIALRKGIFFYCEAVCVFMVSLASEFENLLTQLVSTAYI